MFTATINDPNWVAFLSDRDAAAGTSTRDLYVMRPDGSAQTRVTSLALPDFTGVAISPDGWTLAFGRGPASAQDIWLVNRDGTGLQQLTSVGDAGQPAWSPDGNHLVFRREFVGIFTIGRDGGGLAQVTAEWDDTPAWSPDGTRIAFNRNVNHSSTCYSDIFVVRTDGSGLARLTTDGAGSWCGAAGWPAWAPDGGRIAFGSNRGTPVGSNPTRNNVWVMAADGSNQVQLTTAPQSDSPTWTPDGAAVLFWSDRSGNLEVWTMAADGSGQRPLTNAPGIDFLPYLRK
ncbi:MAG: PD40 domain-containing protein [Gemmatimonadales bacterium]|nr:PD40 domain-containing protein [Gemmatimonadales bacterium]